jgi:hypothetical protein
MKTNLTIIIISAILYLALLFARPYGDSRTLNQGWYIGPSDTCQVGYETRGTTGFFAYCETK